MGLVEVFDDRERLGQGVLAVDQRRYELLRIQSPVLRAGLLPAVAGEMNVLLLGDDSLQVERDAHPIGRGAAEISEELHGRKGGDFRCNDSALGPIAWPPPRRAALAAAQTVSELTTAAE